MSKENHISIRMGALVPTIEHQLIEQGVQIVPPDLVDDLQKDADAITRLLIRRIITQAEGDKARKRIMKEFRKLRLETITGE